MKRAKLYPFLLLILLKIIIFVFYLTLVKSNHPELFEGLAKYNLGDAPQYIEPYLNYLNGGELGNVYRMPYYFFFFAFFKLFFSKATALSALVIFQLILDIISSALLMIIAYKEYKSIKLSWLLSILLAFSLHSSQYTICILTESLSFSFTIISFYFLYSHIKTNSKYYFFFSSFFFGYAVLLKPPYIFFGLIFIFTLFLVDKRKGLFIRLTNSTKKGILYILPFVILISPWTYRNFKKHDDFVLFYKFEDCCSELLVKAVEFIKIRGGDIIWHDYSAGNYFFNEKNNTFSIPEFFLCESCDVNRIKNLRNNFVLHYNGVELADSLEQATMNDLVQCNESYKKERPLDYYLYSRLRLVKNFLIHSGSYFMPYTFNESGIPLKVFKLLQSILYYLALIIGVPYLIYLSFSKLYFVPIASFAVILILFYPVYFRLIEWRYFELFFPFAILGFGIFVKEFIQSIKKER